MIPSGLEILAHEETPLGLLCLRRRGIPGRPGATVTEITLDHEFLMSSYVTASEEALARLAIGMHGGRGLSVLIGGLGLGYTARAALASDRVAHVDVVELLPQVIGWLRGGLVPLSAELTADPRFHAVQGDVYARLSGPPQRTYDLVLVDVDHSPAEHLGGANASFYGDDGLALAKRHLAPGGVLGVWSYAQDTPFAHALRRVFREVHEEGITVVNDLVDTEQTDWLFFARG